MEKTYYFIVNTHSRTGQSRQVWEKLEQILQQRNILYEAFLTEYERHAQQITEQLTAGDEEIRLVVCGGDGTVNEVLNGIRDFSRVTFAYIPIGSANDFARGLGLSESPEVILNKLLDSQSLTWIDLGLVQWDGGSRRFGISAGIGLDAMVCRRASTSGLKTFLNRFHLGGLTYGILTVTTLFQTKATDARIKTAEGDDRVLPRMVFSAAMNFSCEGGGVPMAPEASARDGRLSLCSLYRLPRILCLLCFPFLLMGKHKWIPAFRISETNEVRISLGEATVVHADGEDCGDHREVTFSVLPKALRMIAI